MPQMAFTAVVMSDQKREVEASLEIQIKYSVFINFKKNKTYHRLNQSSAETKRWSWISHSHNVSISWIHFHSRTVQET